ncbi:MAG TPA: hypothetical protein VEN30_17695 [Paraburkholderia sp.]|nr:hypothetical protein [Paraburkholderia sp.]
MFHRHHPTWPGNGLNGRAGLMWQMVNAGLRGFKMPERIFIVGKAGSVPALPPLPPEMTP